MVDGGLHFGGLAGNPHDMVQSWCNRRVGGGDVVQMI